jgi:hypothetical protein
MLEEKVSFSFSQPAYLDDMLLNSQLHATQPSTQPSSQVQLCRLLNVMKYESFYFYNYWVADTMFCFTEHLPETGATDDTFLCTYKL